MMPFRDGVCQCIGCKTNSPRFHIDAESLDSRSHAKGELAVGLISLLAAYGLSRLSKKGK